jgi:hypothetical protein
VDELMSYLPQVHGNTKEKDSAPRYKRTLPSVYNELQSQLMTQTASAVYKKSTKNDGPRNSKQCKNIRTVILQQFN